MMHLCITQGTYWTPLLKSCEDAKTKILSKNKETENAPFMKKKRFLYQ